jgi:myo-inositol-1(or 4)-monophosphatase
MLRAHESELAKSHRLHRARRSADVAGMRGIDQHDANGNVQGRVLVICEDAARSAAARLPSDRRLFYAARPMHGMVNIAVRAARRAGEIMVRQMNQLEALKVVEKSRNEFVSQVDQAAEAAIIEVIRDHYPDHSILAEESGAAGEHEYQWIIDPLDGTTNYLHGFPQFSVSIGVARKGELEHGVVYDPLRQEIFTASRGQGAQLDGRRIRVSKRTTLQQSLIATGFPYRANLVHIERYLGMLKAVMLESSGVRRPGSAALDLCYVAAGRVDAFFELGLSKWDIAAGALIIREAGGRISDFHGGDGYLDSGNVVCGNPKVYAALSKLLAPFSAGVP